MKKRDELGTVASPLGEAEWGVAFCISICLENNNTYIYISYGDADTGVAGDALRTHRPVSVFRQCKNSDPTTQLPVNRPNLGTPWT